MNNSAASRVRWVVGLFSGALLLRLVHVWTVHTTPPFTVLLIDPAMYDEWARRIASGSFLSDMPFFLDPLYPYFVAVIYAVTGPSPLAVAWVQCLLGAAAVPLIYLATRRWCGEPVACWAGILAAIYAPAIYWAAPLMKPGLALCAAALGLWLLSLATSAEARRGVWVASGAALALAGLLRGTVLFVLPFVALWVVVSAPWHDGAAPRFGAKRWRAAAALVGGAAIVLAFPAAHNLAVSGEPILATVNQGQIFFIGNNASNPTGRFSELPFVSSRPALEQRDFKREAERRVGHALSHRGVSRYWFVQGLDWIRAHPADWARVTWSKLRLWWGAYETPASLDYYLVREHAPVLRLPLPGFGFLGPLALLGGVLALRLRGWPALVTLFAAATCLTAVPFFVLTRFRMVAMPALYVLAALAMVELVRRCRFVADPAAPERWALLPLLLLAVFVVFVNVPVHAIPSSWTYRAAAAIGLPVRAENTAKAHFNLGVSYAAQAKDEGESPARLQAAETELREALRQQPDATSWVELGKVLARQHRDADAIAAYVEAERLAPGDPRIHHALGLLERRRGDLAAAERHFRDALELAPQQWVSAVQLGEVLLEDGRPAEAEAAFRHALALRPDDAAAREGLRAAEAATR